jgi:CRP-like cAMP-binding protein
LLKPHVQRSYEENEQLYNFLVKEVPFFKDLKDKRSRAFFYRIFEFLELKFYQENAILCKYGEMGDTFFIILSGDIAV